MVAACRAAECGACARSGPTAYTGSAGLGLALWHAGRLTQQQDWQQEGEALAARALREVHAHPGRYVAESLLDGRAGVVLINALMASARSDAAEANRLLAAYAELCTIAAQPESGASDEFLYGRAGTLLGALLLRHCLGPSALPDMALHGLAQAMLASGRALAARVPAFVASGTPLGYMWPPGRRPEPYLGAAHGLMGILYVLLLARRHTPGCCLQGARDLEDVRTALGYVLSCERDAPGAPRGSGGHYPTLMPLQGWGGGEGGSCLVHWCHGAPGAVHLWCTAHEVLGGSSEHDLAKGYLPAALRAGELVWQHGLLKKGPGLCHGVSGNAYALLRLGTMTQDPKWLSRAQQFAAFMVSDAGRADWPAPDHPASLFEGLAGGVCLVAELQAAGGVAGVSGFPLFELVKYV